MQTTVNIPDALFHQVEASAASLGQSIEQFVQESLSRQLEVSRPKTAKAGWLDGLPDLSPEAKEEAGKLHPTFLSPDPLTEPSAQPSKNVLAWREILGTLSPAALAEARKLSEYFNSPEARRIDPEDWE